MRKMRVYKVNSGHIHLVNSKPKALIVCVMGSASSSGWTQAELGPWVYVTPPVDGIYDFDLIANPPTGTALQVITPIAAATAFPDPPTDIKGIRIHATSNNLEILLDTNSSIDFPDADVKPAGIFPWPDISG